MRGFPLIAQRTREEWGTRELWRDRQKAKADSLRERQKEKQKRFPTRLLCGGRQKESAPRMGHPSGNG